MRVQICICKIHVCIFTYTNILTGLERKRHIHTQIITHICIHMCVYIHEHTFLSLCIYIHLFINIYSYTASQDIHICIYMHIYISVYTYTCIYTPIYFSLCICIYMYIYTRLHSPLTRMHTLPLTVAGALVSLSSIILHQSCDHD